MTYVVVEMCVDCKYTDCAAVCPVEAFHELPDRLYINADTCIDCDACVPECPVEAIFADNAVPEQYAHWTQINIDEAPNYPVISQKIPALHGPSLRGAGRVIQRLCSVELRFRKRSSIGRIAVSNFRVAFERSKRRRGQQRLQKSSELKSSNSRKARYASSEAYSVA